MLTSEESDFLHQLFKLYYKKMFLFAIDITDNEMIAEDVVAATFEAALQNVSTLIVHSNPIGWLFITLKRKILNTIRDSHEDAYVFVDNMDDIPAQDIVPCLQALYLEDIPKEFEILIWYYGEQISYSEICRRLNISYDACRARMSRTLKRFKVWYLTEYDLPQKGGPHAKSF